MFQGPTNTFFPRFGHNFYPRLLQEIEKRRKKLWVFLEKVSLHLFHNLLAYQRMDNSCCGEMNDLPRCPLRRKDSGEKDIGIQEWLYKPYFSANSG